MEDERDDNNDKITQVDFGAYVETFHSKWDEAEEEDWAADLRAAA